MTTTDMDINQNGVKIVMQVSLLGTSQMMTVNFRHIVTTTRGLQALSKKTYKV